MIGEKTKAVEDFWQQCRRDLNIATTNYHASTFADPQFLDFNDPLLDLSEQPRLVAARKKQGTAHLLIDFEINGIPRRKVGDYWVVLNFDNEPWCLVRVVDIFVKPFNEVPESFAEREGEGEMTQRWWQDAHRAYFQPQCAKWKVEWREDLPTVCESFDLVHVLPDSAAKRTQ
jgi:uncharacterized protein YhfF